MDKSMDMISVKSKRWSEKELSSIRGSFTYMLMTLQERLQHLKDPDKLLLPVIDRLDWDVTKAFWRGTIMDADGNKPSNSAYAPHNGAIRLLLHIYLNHNKFKIDTETKQQIELNTSEILRLALILRNTSRLAFSPLEQNYIRTRIAMMFPSDKEVSGLIKNEQELISFFRDPTNFELVSK